MDIQQLQAATGVPVRQIRYLISNGFIPGPGGSRSQPHYDQRHVAAISRYMAHRSRLKPAQIRALDTAMRLLREQGDGVLELGFGIRLLIDPDALDPAMDTAAAGEVVTALLNHHLNKDKPDAP